MSAPDVNLKKQKKRHSPVLVGMLIIGVSVLAFVVYTATLPVENDAAMEVAPAATGSELN